MDLPKGFRLSSRNSDEIVRTEKLYLRGDILGLFFTALLAGGISIVLVIIQEINRFDTVSLVFSIVMLTISLSLLFYLFTFFRNNPLQREIRLNRREKSIQIRMGDQQQTFSYYVIGFHISGSEYRGGRRIAGHVVVPDSNARGKRLTEKDIGLSDREKCRLVKDQQVFFEVELFLVKNPDAESIADKIDNFMHYYDANLKKKIVPYKSQYSTCFQPQPPPLLFYSNRAYASQKHEQYDLAFKDLEQALRLNPKVASIWVQKAENLKHLKKPEEAISCLDKALEILLKQEKERIVRDLDSEISIDIYEERAKLFFELGQYHKALADITAVIESEWEMAFAEHYIFRGNLYLEQKQYKKAVNDFNWCLENDEPEEDESFEIYKGLGKAYFYLEKSPEASSNFKKALGIKPDKEIEQLQKDISG